MNTRKTMRCKFTKKKEENKRPVKTLFTNQKRINPNVYLSYYTSNTMNTIDTGMSMSMGIGISQGSSTNAMLPTKKSTLPMIQRYNSPSIITHIQPKQDLVESLLLSKRWKMSKDNRIKPLNNTINFTHTTRNESLSKFGLITNANSNSKANLKANIPIQTQSQIKAQTKSNVMSHMNTMQSTLATESNEKLNLPKISKITTTTTLTMPNISNNQKSSRDRSNSIISIKSTHSNGNNSSNNNNNNTHARKSKTNISYSDFVSSMKIRKSSKFTSVKHQNDFDSACDIFPIENKIIRDFIGKTYNSTDDDAFSCFFASTGNFHCPLFNLFGVVEGNGRHGRQIASLTRSNLHTYLTSGITYGFKNSKVSEYEIYESIIRNNYEPIRFANERIHDDMIKSNLDMDTSGVSITVMFIIGKKLICINVGDVRAVAFIEKSEKGKEILVSQLLSSLDLKTDESNVNGNRKVLTNSLGNKASKHTGYPSVYCTDITEDYLHIIIASRHFWDCMTYGNVFKFFSPIQTDNIISKAEQIMTFKEKQNELYNRKKMPYSFCLIEL